MCKCIELGQALAERDAARHERNEARADAMRMREDLREAVRERDSARAALDTTIERERDASRKFCVKYAEWLKVKEELEYGIGAARNERDEAIAARDDARDAGMKAIKEIVGARNEREKESDDNPDAFVVYVTIGASDCAGGVARAVAEYWRAVR